MRKQTVQSNVRCSYRATEKRKPIMAKICYSLNHCYHHHHHPSSTSSSSLKIKWQNGFGEKTAHKIEKLITKVNLRGRFVRYMLWSAKSKYGGIYRSRACAHINCRQLSLERNIFVEIIMDDCTICRSNSHRSSFRVVCCADRPLNASAIPS